MGKQENTTNQLLNANQIIINDSLTTTPTPIPAISNTINNDPRSTFSIVKSSTTTTSLTAKPSTNNNKRKAPIAPSAILIGTETSAMPAKVISSTTTTTTITIKEYPQQVVKSSNKSSTKSYSSCGGSNSSDSSSADSCCGESLLKGDSHNATHETNITKQETKSLLNSTSSAISSSNSSLSNNHHNQLHSSNTVTSTNTHITNALVNNNNTTLSHYLSDDTRTDFSIDDSIMLQFNESCNYSHREVAIDCPENFVPQVKTRPSYPSNSLPSKKDDKKEKEKDKSAANNTLSTFKSKFAATKETKSKNEAFKIVQSAPKIVEKKSEGEFDEENEIKRRLKESEEAALSLNVRTSGKMQMLKEAPKIAVIGAKNEIKAPAKLEHGNVNSGFEHDDDEDATNRMETDSLDDFDDEPNSNEIKIKSVEHVVVVTEARREVAVDVPVEGSVEVTRPISSAASTSSSISQKSNENSDDPLFKIVTAQKELKAAAPDSEQNLFKPFGNKNLNKIQIFFYVY